MNENRRITLMAGGILLLLAAVGAYLFWPAPAPPDATTPVAASPATPEAPASSATTAATEPLPDHYTLPATATPAEAAALPALAESDGPFSAAMGGLADPALLLRVLVSEQLIRRLVATVDNLPRERLAMNDRAFRRMPDSFMVKSRDGSYALNPANEARYVLPVQLANTAGADNTARLYLRFYPLFDKAYRELGDPDRHFNDRLVQVIDHLLATPEITGPIELVQPKVFYQFADPALESRSAGQKMLIRMGTVNAAQVKAWLRTFRAQITAA
ncbi:MAG: DUF3014 domain-containing protein [Pseudomonadota bacterium]